MTTTEHWPQQKPLAKSPHKRKQGLSNLKHFMIAAPNPKIEMNG